MDNKHPAHDQPSMEGRLSVEDGKLTELLATLPRERASEDFTARVLQRIEATPPQVSGQRWPMWTPLLAAAALLFIALGFGGRELWHRHQVQESVARYKSLSAEHAALEMELRRLRRLAVVTRPVIYLGGDETVEYVVDLSRSHRRCEEASCIKLASQTTDLGSIAPTPLTQQKEMPSMPTASPHSVEISKIDGLAPAQLRQNPRRIY
jgi:hypothetical protein